MGRAVGLMDPADPGRDSMLVEQASSLMWAGRVAAARQMCSTLLERAHAGEAEGPARLCLGYALVAQSQQRDALPELERAAGSPVLTEAERAGARAWAGYARLAIADLDGASATASEARSAAPADPLVTSVAMATQALVTVHRWHPAGALETIDDAVRRADQSPGRHGHRFPIHITRAFILTELDRLDEARSTLDTGRRIGEELGIGWQLPNYQMISAVTRFLAGEWDDAIAEVEAARELASEADESHSLILGHCALAMIWVHRNDLGRARQAAGAAMGQLGERGARYRALWAMWAHALLLEAKGQAADAFALLAEAWDRCAQLGLTLDYRAFGPDLVRLALASGERERARAVAAAMTGSAALFAETLHSLADTGNQLLLLTGLRRARRRPDARHPFGYGAELFYWSLLAALGIFVVGGVLSVWEGVQRLLHPSEVQAGVLGFAVLGLGCLLDGTSWLGSVRQLRREAAARGVPFRQHLRSTTDTAVTAVFYEDSAALAGNAIALAGLGARQLTGSAAPDAAAGIVIGVLLAAIGLRLAARNRALLTNRSESPAVLDRIRGLLAADPAVAAVGQVASVYIGPHQLLLTAEIQPLDTISGLRLRQLLAELRERIAQAIPRVAVVSLMPVVAVEPPPEPTPWDRDYWLHRFPDHEQA
jgi:cation diffusion facilitator family transporter